MVWVIPFCSSVVGLNWWLGTQKLSGVDRSAQTRPVHIKSPRILLHTPPNRTCSRWYDHEWLKADYKPDSPTPLFNLPCPLMCWLRMHPVMDRGGLRSFDSKGCVVEQPASSPYKLSRAGDCFPHLEEIPEVAVCHMLPGSDEQHYTDALSEQDKMDQVQVLGLEGSVDCSVVSELKNFLVSGPDFGTAQCQGGSHLHSLECPTEWSLDHRVTSLLFDIWGLPTVDLFVTRLKKVEFSLLASQTPWSCKAIPGKWIGRRVYCTCIPHCPSPSLSLSLHNVIREKAKVITILLWWPQRRWFPLVLQFLVVLPVLLPAHTTAFSSSQMG